MDKLEFYQKHYFAELDRRHQLNNSLAIPLGVVSLLSGTLSYLISNYSFDWNIPTFIFCFFIGGAAISISSIIYFLIRSYWSYVYQYLTDTEELRKYEIDLRNYYVKSEEIEFDKQVDRDMDEMIIRKYSIAATHNAINNAKKSANLHKSNTSIVCLIIFVLLSAPIYFWNYQHYKKTFTKINYEVNMGKEQDSDKTKQNIKHEKPAEKVAEKPKEPPNKYLREFTEEEKKNKQKLND